MFATGTGGLRSDAPVGGPYGHWADAETVRIKRCARPWPSARLRSTVHQRLSTLNWDDRAWKTHHAHRLGKGLRLSLDDFTSPDGSANGRASSPALEKVAT